MYLETQIPRNKTRRLEDKSMGWDLFNREKVSQLKKQLELADKKVASQESDIKLLKRENYELKVQLGKHPKVSAKFSSTEKNWMSNQNSNARNTPRPSVSDIPKNEVSRSHTTSHSSSNDNLVEGMIIGAAVATAVSYSDDASTDCYDSSSDTSCGE